MTSTLMRRRPIKSLIKAGFEKLRSSMRLTDRRKLKRSIIGYFDVLRESSLTNGANSTTIDSSAKGQARSANEDGDSKMKSIIDLVKSQTTGGRSQAVAIQEMRDYAEHRSTEAGQKVMLGLAEWESKTRNGRKLQGAIEDLVLAVNKDKNDIEGWVDMLESAVNSVGGEISPKKIQEQPKLAGSGSGGGLWNLSAGAEDEDLTMDSRYRNGSEIKGVQVMKAEDLKKGSVLKNTNHGFEIEIVEVGKKNVRYKNLRTGEKVKSLTSKFDFMLREGVFVAESG